jgi:acylphosphatase
VSERVHLVVSGRVQGVWFRASTRREADRLGLTGWVRNLPDGRVEAVAEGKSELLDDFVRWCGHGPPHARVDGVEETRGAATGEFTTFLVVG